MCSAPKGSTTRRRHVRKSEFSRSDYQEYARMVRRASAIYDGIEKEKSERMKLMASQKPAIPDKQIEVSKDENNSQFNVVLYIKAQIIVKTRYFPVSNKGKITTLPADFLIDEHGVIDSIYYGKDSGDHLPFDRMKSFSSRQIN